jgi:hypothetical protein
MSITNVLIDKYGDFEWSITEDDYDSLVWRSDSPKPSLETLEAFVAESNTNLAFKRLRAERDKLLSACDWTQISDASVDKVAWATYRQELRDLPENTIDPENPIWPIPPV